MLASKLSLFLKYAANSKLLLVSGFKLGLPKTGLRPWPLTL